MKKITLLSIAVIISTLVSAQAFEKGTSVVTAGIGLGSSWGFNGNYYNNKVVQTPAIVLQYEKGMWEIGDFGVVSMGGYFGYKSYRYEETTVNYSYKERLTYMVFGVRSAFHFTIIPVEKLDVYAGIMLGYRHSAYKYEYTPITNNSYWNNYYNNRSYSYPGSVRSDFYAGARYYFTDKFGAFGEFGYGGISYLTVGLAFKL